MKYCILLTACVNPNGMSQTVLQNAEVRQRQYIEAIAYYLHKTKERIVFVENTGVDLSRFFNGERYINRIEWLTYCGNKYDPLLGKGFGESQSLQYALSNSAFIKDCDFIIKITGRLKLLNYRCFKLEHILFPKRDVTLSYDCQNFPDSRLIFATKSFFEKQFLVQCHLLNDANNCYFETLLNEVLLSNKTKVRCFCCSLPRFSGVSGTSGIEYKIISFFTRLYWQKIRLNLHCNKVFGYYA